MAFAVNVSLFLTGGRCRSGVAKPVRSQIKSHIFYCATAKSHITHMNIILFPLHTHTFAQTLFQFPLFRKHRIELNWTFKTGKELHAAREPRVGQAWFGLRLLRTLTVTWQYSWQVFHWMRKWKLVFWCTFAATNIIIFMFSSETRSSGQPLTCSDHWGRADFTLGWPVGL